MALSFHFEFLPAAGRFLVEEIGNTDRFSRKGPYFFIEFKKDDKDSQCAENQIAAAASMALHNRFNLRIRRMEKSQKPFHTLNVSNLRVYAITFRASEYTVWCVKPKFDTDTFRWAGCDMTRIWEGTCTVAVGVRSKFPRPSFGLPLP